MNKTLHVPDEPRFGQGSMIVYVLPHIHQVLHETLALAVASPQVMVSRVRYIVPVNGTIHHVRRDRACDCGGTPDTPCPAIPLVLDYLAAGGPRPLGRHEDTWPESWVIVPALCPICDCPTIPDRYLNSSHGPGWRCTFDPSHYWQVRLNPLRRLLASRPSPFYPWEGTTPAERQAWIDAHYHPPRLAPTHNEGENHNALDRTPTGAGGHWPGPALPWLETVWLSRGSERSDDRLLRAGQLGWRG